MADEKVGGLLLAVAGVVGLGYALRKRKPENGEVPKCPIGKVWDEAIQDCVDEAPPSNVFFDILGLTVKPEVVILGGEVTLAFQVTNLGDEYSPLWRVKVHEAATIGTGDLVYDSGSVSRGSIAMNATVEEEFSYTTKQKPNDGRDVFLTLYGRDGTELAKRKWRGAFRVSTLGSFRFISLLLDGKKSLIPKSPGDHVSVAMRYRYMVPQRSWADVHYRIPGLTGWEYIATLSLDRIGEETDDGIEMIPGVRLPDTAIWGIYDFLVRVEGPLFQTIEGALPGALMIFP